MFRQHITKGFTLLEFLATVAILAVLISGAIYFTVCYVQWARQNTDHEVYAVLNDELTRYKSNGGNVTALTAGAPIADIFAALKTPVVPAGMPASLAQQFMATNYTFPGRSLQATGNYQQYHFCGVDIYNDGTASTSGGSGGGGGGSGVGSMANGGAAGGYPNFIVQSSTGYVTVLPVGGAQQVVVADGSTNTALGVASSVSFWSSDASGNPNGTLTGLGCNSDNLTSLNVTGLTGLTYLDCDTNNLPSLNISGLASIVSIDCSINPAITGSVSALNALYGQLPTEAPSYWGAFLHVNDNKLAASGSNVTIANDKNWVCDAPVNLAGVTPQAYPGSGGFTMSNGGSGAFTINCFPMSSTGYIAYQLSGGQPKMYTTYPNKIFTSANSITIWSVDAAGLPTGAIICVATANITSISGLQSLPYLQNICIQGCLSPSSLNLSGMPNLLYVTYIDANLSALDVSSCPNLSQLFCGGNNTGMTINITGDHALPAQCTDGSTAFWTDPGAVITGP